MILTGDEIRKNLGTNIIIDPFDEQQLNPNSYNLTLHDEVMTYEEVVLDMRKTEPRTAHDDSRGRASSSIRTSSILGRTVERTETHNFVPMIEGRSSIGRLGLFVHVTAGFGDVGFCGFWTLEMFAVQPVRIYPGRSDLPDLLSLRSPARYPRIRQRQVSAQPRHPAESAVQGTQSGRGSDDPQLR